MRLHHIFNIFTACYKLWLIDFNSMSTHPGLFYAMRLENCIHCTYIVTFVCSYFCMNASPEMLWEKSRTMQECYRLFWVNPGNIPLKKRATVWPLISHLTNYRSKTNKTCWAQLKKLGQTYKQHGCGVMVIVVGNGHGGMSSNPGRNWLHFTLH